MQFFALPDASSGFLGFVLAVMAVAVGQQSPELAVAWLALLGLFVVDASVTLVRRALRRERIHEAHRSHAYQRLARRLQGHLPVTLGAAGVTWFWLFPIAIFIATDRLPPVAGLILAYVPLVIVALLSGAGAPDEEEFSSA